MLNRLMRLFSIGSIDSPSLSLNCVEGARAPLTGSGTLLSQFANLKIQIIGMRPFSLSLRLRPGDASFRLLILNSVPHNNVVRLHHSKRVIRILNE